MSSLQALVGHLESNLAGPSSAESSAMSIDKVADDSAEQRHEALESQHAAQVKKIHDQVNSDIRSVMYEQGFVEIRTITRLGDL